MSQRPDELVEVRTGLSTHDAYLLKNYLQSQEIQAFVQDDDMASMQYAVQARILVKSHDLVKAQSVLENVVTMNAGTTFDAQAYDVFCPKCGSYQVHPHIGAVPSPVPGITVEAKAEDRYYHCLQCDNYFPEKRSRYTSLPFGCMWGICLSLGVIALIWFIEWLRYL